MIPQFALRLICGLATMWTLSPRKDITSGFFRIQMLLNLGLSVLLAVTASQYAGANESVDGISPWVFGLGMTLAGCSFLGSIFWTLGRRFAGTVMGGMIAALATTGVCLLTRSGGSTELGQIRLWAWAESLSAAWLIGSVTATMLLGHWYLTATGMKLTPLTQYNRLFLMAVVLRIVVAAVDTRAHWPQAVDHWTLSTLRWGGLIGPLVMGLLTLRILRYRNTQSATGVLYAATTLVFMGEMAAVLLGGQQAIPPAV